MVPRLAVFPRSPRLWAVLLPLIAAVAGCARTEPDREFWDVLRLAGQRVGYGRTSVRHERNAIVVENVQELSIRRFHDETQLRVRVQSTETPDGAILGFESQIDQGPEPMRTVGRRDGEQMRLEVATQGKTIASTVPCPKDCGGPVAVQQSLWRQPMNPGESRTVSAWEVDTQSPCQTELAARDYESVPLLEGQSRLLRIDAVTRLPNGTAVKQVVWTDGDGEVLKARFDQMNVEAFRAPKEVALAEIGAVKVDLGIKTLVKPDRPLPNPHRTRRVRYHLSLGDADPARALARGPSQQVRPTGPHEADVTVYAVRPGQAGNPEAPPDPPTAADLAPNNLIQSDDTKVIADAKEAAAKETDPWKVAVKLEQYVQRVMTRKDYTQAFATAADVAKSREGDCTEHAVYLAALARARKIPARVAMGLVYMQGQDTFGYHLWTEVYVDKRWIPLDATLGQGGIAADHLKLASSALAGPSPFGDLMPIIEVIGQLQIRIVEVR